MPFLAIGALLSAVIEVFVSTERMLRWIPKTVAGGIALGVGAGFLLPTCECGVVPVARQELVREAPPRGARRDRPRTRMGEAPLRAGRCELERAPQVP